MVELLEQSLTHHLERRGAALDLDLDRRGRGRGGEGDEKEEQDEGGKRGKAAAKPKRKRAGKGKAKKGKAKDDGVEKELEGEADRADVLPLALALHALSTLLAGEEKLAAEAREALLAAPETCSGLFRAFQNVRQSVDARLAVERLRGGGVGAGEEEEDEKDGEGGAGGAEAATEMVLEAVALYGRFLLHAWASARPAVSSEAKAEMARFLR